MLQRIHERAQGWIAWVIIGLICMTFALWGIESYLTPGGNAQTVATVGDIEITRQQLTTATDRLKALRQAQSGNQTPLPEAMVQHLQQQALDQLVMGAALSQAAKKQDFRVGQAQINQVISQLPIFQENGQFSQTLFLNALSQMNYSPAQFMQLMGDDLVMNQVNSGIINTSFATAAEAKQAMALIDQTRDINYGIIPAKRFVDLQNITEAAQKNYYEQHKALFQTPEQASIDYVELSLADLEKKVQVTEAEIAHYYANNKANYSTKARWQVAHILIKYPSQGDNAALEKTQALAQTVAAKAKAGEDFNKLVKEYSQDVLSVKKEGVLPWFSQNTLDPNFEKAVLGLHEPGDITGPVPTKYGYEIIKLLKVEPAHVSALATVQAQITAFLQQQKVEQLFAEENDKLATISYENPNSLEPVAKALNLPIQSTGSFGKEGGEDAFTKNPQVLNAVFSPEVLQGTNSELLTLNDNSVAVVRIKKYEPAATQAFASVQAQIKQTLTQEASIAAAQQLGEQLIAQLPEAKSVKDLLQKNDIVWEHIENLPRQETSPDLVLVRAVFAAPLPTAKPYYQGTRLSTGDYAIFTVNKVRPGSLDKAELERRKTFYQDMAMGYGLSEYDQYRVGEIKKAQVEYEKGAIMANVADQ